MPRAAIRPERRRTPGELAAAIEAVASLASMRAALAAFPFRRICGWLGLSSAAVDVGPSPGTAGACAPATRGPGDPAAGVDEASRIGWAIRAAAARTPWTNSCLVEALAASRMLGRRGVPHELRLGVADPGADQAPASGRDFAAHAWLTCGGRILVGDKGLERFAPLAVFVFSARRP